MNWGQMKDYEPGLENLEQRMTAIRRFIDGYYAADNFDIEKITLGYNGLPPRELLCMSKLREEFTRGLLLLVGPGGMHPLIKEPECYTTARQKLFSRFPDCGHRCECMMVIT